MLTAKRDWRWKLENLHPKDMKSGNHFILRYFWILKKNQKVTFQIDAFNYNQWGLLEGKVIDIDKNITIQENQAFFKVRCSLKTKTMQLKSGYKTQVSKGMTLTTRYIITRRSLFELLFDKVDDWLNPKQIK